MEIKETDTLPYYNFINNVITLKGVSIDDEVKKFFTDVIDDIVKNLAKPRDIKMIIDLVYFNTRTSRYIMDIFNIFKDLIISKGYKVIIDWYYEEDDIDMCDTAIDYQGLTGIPINTISRRPTDNEGIHNFY